MVGDFEKRDALDTITVISPSVLYGTSISPV
jgi:hypothetical protein